MMRKWDAVLQSFSGRINLAFLFFVRTTGSTQVIFNIVSINATAASSSSFVRFLFDVLLNAPQGELHLPALTSAGL